MIRRALVHVVLPLALGVAAYFAFRPAEIRLFEWASWLGLDAPVRALRHAAAPLRAFVPGALVGSGPDAAWAYAFGAALALVWRRAGASGCRFFWIWLGAAFTTGVELGQALRLFQGRFDLADLAAMLAGYGLAWLALRDRGAQPRSSQKERAAFRGGTRLSPGRAGARGGVNPA